MSATSTLAAPTARTREPVGRGRAHRYGAWFMCGLLAVLFGGAGIAKLAGGAEVIQRFQGWDYSEPFRVFIGLCEIAGAIGLLVPRLSLSACGGLGGIMLGAIYTHVAHDEAAWFALVVLGLVVATGWLRREDAFFTRARPAILAR